MSISCAIAEFIGIKQDRAIKLQTEFNDALIEMQKSTLHFQHLLLLLNLPKHTILEQRYLCAMYGVALEHNLIRRTIDNLHMVKSEEK